MRTPRLPDVVGLLVDVPAHAILHGQVGTIVELSWMVPSR